MTFIQTIFIFIYYALRRGYDVSSGLVVHRWTSASSFFILVPWININNNKNDVSLQWPSACDHQGLRLLQQQHRRHEEPHQGLPRTAQGTVEGGAGLSIDWVGYGKGWFSIDNWLVTVASEGLLECCKVRWITVVLRYQSNTAWGMVKWREIEIDSFYEV